MIEISRRGLLGAAAVGSVAVALPGAAAEAAPASRASANGWPILAHAATHDIEGSGRRVALADAAAVILTSVARRFHYEIDQLRDGDVHGHTTGHTTGRASGYESNYRSGSAIAIRPLAYPAGAKGGFYEWELVVVRDILASLDGVVAWGGDFDVPKESHFEIALGPSDPRVRALAVRLGGDSVTGLPGAIDAFEPARRTRSDAFRKRR